MRLGSFFIAAALQSNAMLEIFVEFLTMFGVRREEHLPPDGPTMQVPTRCGLLLLVRNILLSREPIQRHQIDREETTEVLVTKLSPLHRQLIKLLGLKPTHYGK